MRIRRLPLLLALGLLPGLGLAACGDDDDVGAECGNGIAEPGEECDDAVPPMGLATGSCTASCTWQTWNPDTLGTGSAMNPRVAMNGEGAYVVVWEAGTDPDTDKDIYASLYDRSGRNVIPAFRVNESTGGLQLYPSAGMDDQGRFAVVWHSEDPADPNAFIRFYDANGSPLTGETQLNTWTGGAQTTAALAANGSGDLVVTWTSDGQDGDLTGVYARVGSTAGQLSGEPFLVNTVTDNKEENPGVGMAADGRFVIAWEGWGQEST